MSRQTRTCTSQEDVYWRTQQYYTINSYTRTTRKKGCACSPTNMHAFVAVCVSVLGCGRAELWQAASEESERGEHLPFTYYYCCVERVFLPFRNLSFFLLRSSKARRNECTRQQRAIDRYNVYIASACSGSPGHRTPKKPPVV